MEMGDLAIHFTTNFEMSSSFKSSVGICGKLGSISKQMYFALGGLPWARALLCPGSRADARFQPEVEQQPHFRSRGAASYFRFVLQGQWGDPGGVRARPYQFLPGLWRSRGCGCGLRWRTGWPQTGPIRADVLSLFGGQAPLFPSGNWQP